MHGGKVNVDMSKLHNMDTLSEFKPKTYIYWLAIYYNEKDNYRTIRLDSNQYPAR